MVDASKYTPRLLDKRITSLFSELPALLITGPRACGKTTSGRRAATTFVRLDREREATAFRSDPDAALRSLPEPVLLDEWQSVPGVLGAVKRAVDDDFRPGRFILTGSVRDDLVADQWPGTGRLIRLHMYGLTAREQTRNIDGPTFLDRLASADIDAFAAPKNDCDLRDYVSLALRGGFPEAALHMSKSARTAWLDGYLTQLFTRDAPDVDGARDPARLRRYFEVLALNTAGIVNDKTLYDAAGINRNTAVAYERLLENMFVLEPVPAWTSNRLSRLVKGAKRYLVDPSLAATALRLDESAVLRDGDMLGRLIDTFVAAQIRPELDASTSRPRLYHLREKEGRREIDLIAETNGNSIVGIECKATAAPTSSDAKHLGWLRDTVGARFTVGVVFHTGPRPFMLEDRIFALPISTLWS